MERFEHGGNVYAHPVRLDFSANLNPLGMPAAAREALREAVDDFARYPDPACTEYVRAVADFEGVPEAWVVPCAGATDAFSRIGAVVARESGNEFVGAREEGLGGVTPCGSDACGTGGCGADVGCPDALPHGPQALVCAPCYSGYEQATELAGIGLRVHELREDEGFAVTRAFVDAIAPGVRLVFVANPNNPTGICVEREVLLAVLARAREVGALVVLDECFVDLTDQAGSVDLLAGNPHLVLVKALTKSFCLAGLRAGYALCADAGLRDELWAAGQPWVVSVPAQVAGVACLGERGYLERSRAYVARERAWLFAQLVRLGVEVVPGQANYLMFRAREDLAARMLERGILVRACDNYRGLGRGWHRVAVRTRDENVELVRALEEVVWV